ncbi:NEAT domain-containing protein [Paenibacillus sp. SC116]|uniref:NEAT domain-containing protein n=1 Tax=Paenibacillus sp. SC116 TaxID=2968986 RepID=UPI00215A88AD|nr:NEAT domain-containing protein [Paenibacillus sp. SC116]MCR8844937.1 NEAT domain-containing protein [Paenibacillus sp. SC116]
MKLRTAAAGILAALWIWTMILPGSAYAATKLDNGTYTADYVVLQAENDNVSIANDYWEKPATVVINDGKATVRMTINHSKWVTEFKIPSNGSHVNTKLIESNTKADTRLVEFEADVTNPIISKIHVTVPEIDYDHDYTIRIVFDMKSFKELKEVEKKQETAPVVVPKDTSSTNKPAPEKATKDVPKKKKPEDKKKSDTKKPDAKKPPASKKPPTSNKPSTSTKPPANKKPNASSNTKKTAAETRGELTKEEATSPAGMISIEKKTADTANSSEENKQLPATQLAVSGTAEVKTLGAEADPANEKVATTKEGVVKTASVKVGETTDSSTGSTSTTNWWTPIVAILLLAVGGIYIWKRKS